VWVEHTVVDDIDGSGEPDGLWPDDHQELDRRRPGDHR